MIRANCIKVGHIRLPKRDIPINFSSNNFNDDKYGFFYFYVRDILRDFSGVGDKKLKNIEEFIKMFKVKVTYVNRFPIKFYTWYRIYGDDLHIQNGEEARYQEYINKLDKYSFVKIRFKTYTELMKYKMAKEV